MTNKTCDHIDEHEWYRKEVIEDGTVHYLRCHECGGEWVVKTDHTPAESMTVLHRQVRLLGHEFLRAIGVR